MSIPRRTHFGCSRFDTPVYMLDITKLRGIITYKIIPDSSSGHFYVSWHVGGTERQIESIETHYDDKNGCLTIKGGFGFTPRPKVEQITTRVDVESGEGLRIHLIISASVQIDGA